MERRSIAYYREELKELRSSVMFLEDINYDFKVEFIGSWAGNGPGRPKVAIAPRTVRIDTVQRPEASLCLLVLLSAV